MFGRRRRPPAALRPTLDRNERILAWARTTADPVTAVVVTTHGLWLPGQPGRLGWHQIHKAAWAGSRLTVIPARPQSQGDGYTVMVDDTEISVNLADPGDVPSVVRERVTKSVASTDHYPLPEGGLRVVSRRVAGQNGLAWHVRYDDGTDPTDPHVAAITHEIVAEAAAPAQPE